MIAITNIVNIKAEPRSINLRTRNSWRIISLAAFSGATQAVFDGFFNSSEVANKFFSTVKRVANVQPVGGVITTD